MVMMAVVFAIVCPISIRMRAKHLDLAVTSVARGSVSKLVLRCLLSLFALYYLMPVFAVVKSRRCDAYRPAA